MMPDMDIQEVAQRAGVSAATVSRVLNNSPKVRPETTERVRKVIRELRYVPNNSARSLRMGRTQLLGLIVSDINNPFFPELIQAFEECARERSIDIIFANTGYDPDRLAHCIQRMIERSVDGIAVFTSESNRRMFEFARDRRIPIVLFNQDGPRTSFNNIFVDHASGAREAVEHLNALRHRRIGFISGPDNFDSTRARYKAFLHAMKALDLPVNLRFIVKGDLHVDSGRLAMQKMLSLSPRPSAILATNDLMALGAMQAAHDAGLQLPEELSIIGFDNLPVCNMVTPALTSVDIPRRDIATHAFMMLLKSLENPAGEKLPTPRILTRLHIRSSTRPHAPIASIRRRRPTGYR